MEGHNLFVFNLNLSKNAKCVAGNGRDESSGDESNRTISLQLVQYISVFLGFILNVVTFPYRFAENLIWADESDDEYVSRDQQDAVGSKPYPSKPLSRPPSSVDLPGVSIQNRVEKLESEVGKLAKTSEPGHPSTASSTQDPAAAAERIKSLENELAETKKVSYRNLCGLVFLVRVDKAESMDDGSCRVRRFCGEVLL